jgi:hypothetical protein
MAARVRASARCAHARATPGLPGPPRVAVPAARGGILAPRVCADSARAELLRRTAPTAPMYHPSLPGPPAWGCFTAPPFQKDVAAEALLGMLSTNIFWVGLWDLLDNTIFPNDTNGQMMFLVRARSRAALERPADVAAQIVAGIVGLFFTDSLYEPEVELRPPPRADAGRRLRGPLEAPNAGGDSDDELLPLTNAKLGCAASRPCVAGARR